MMPLTDYFLVKTMDIFNIDASFPDTRTFSHHVFPDTRTFSCEKKLPWKSICPSQGSRCSPLKTITSDQLLKLQITMGGGRGGQPLPSWFGPFWKGEYFDQQVLTLGCWSFSYLHNHFDLDWVKIWRYHSLRNRGQRCHRMNKRSNRSTILPVHQKRENNEHYETK